jgi:hypothetical protein
VKMNFRNPIFRQLLIIALLMLLFQLELFSLERDSSKVKRPGLFVGLTVGSGQTMITNEGISTVSGIVSGKKRGTMGSLDFGYFFTDYFGISSGISFESNHGQLTLNSYQNKFNTTDSENEPYERQVTGSKITEDQKISFLSVPICINLHMPLNKKVGFFLQGGINVALPIIRKYNSSGTFTYKGYYPAYNVVLENLPSYGFPSDAYVEDAGDLELKPVCFNVIASAGVDFFIQKKFQVALAGSYSQTLSDISAYSYPEKFQLSPDVNQINSIMGGSSKATIQALGLKISLRYFLPGK